MTVPKINSAHGSDTRNIINAAIDAINVQGKSIQDLVAEGQLTPTQYATLIESVNGLISKGNVSVNDIDINQGKLLPRHLSEEVLRMMTGDAPVNAVPADNSLTTTKYAPKSVTADKTSFFKKTRNLFSGRYERITVTSVAYRQNKPDENGRTAVVDIEPNADYTIKVHGGNDRFSIGVMNSPLPSNLSSSNTSLDRSVVFSHDLKEYTFRNNAEGKTLLFMPSYDGKEPDIQIEKGASATPYVEPYILPDGSYEPPSTLKEKSVSNVALQDGIVTPEKLSIMRNDNLFDSRYENGMVLIETSEDFNTMYSRSTFNPWDGRVAIVPVKPNTTYTFKINEDEQNFSNVLRVGFASSRPTLELNRFYLKGKINDTGTIKESTLESFADSQYLVIYLSNNGKEPHLIVVEGHTTEGKGDFILPHYLPESALSGGTSKKSDFLPIGDFTNDYQTSQEIENWDINVDAISLQEYYQLWEDLRSQNPEYISRKIIGYAGTENREDDTTLPIYEYRYNERMADNDIQHEKPLLLVQSLIHGNERLAGYHTYLFFKHLAERKNEDFDYIRDNFDIKVLPVASPYSFLHNRRKTASGVDPNRNYESDWSYVQDDGNPTGLFAGDEPMSEKETQYIDQWLAENSHAFGFVDTHNVSGSRVLSQGQVSMCWLISRDDRVKKMAQLILSSLSRKWYKEIPELSVLPSNTNFGYVNSTIAGTTRNQAYIKYGIPSITVDPCWAWYHVRDADGNQVVPTATKNDKNSAIVSNDVIGSVLFGFVKHFV